VHCPSIQGSMREVLPGQGRCHRLLAPLLRAGERIY
jgi:hypothetical protein